MKSPLGVGGGVTPGCGVGTEGGGDATAGASLFGSSPEHPIRWLPTANLS